MNSNPDDDDEEAFVSSHQPPCDRFLREKEEFRLAKNKPQTESWYPYWTAVY